MVGYIVISYGLNNNKSKIMLGKVMVALQHVLHHSLEPN